MTVANPYLEGNYGPVSVEETLVDLDVTGTLPPGLCGRYLRNGPNPLLPPDPLTYHWFTGDGMVHGIRLDGGRARWYRNRWVRSAAVAASLGESPHTGPVVEGMDFAPNTNVFVHAGRTYAIVEAGEPSPEFGGYFMFTRDGIPVAGAMGDMGDLSADNSWKIHLATGDIEATMAQWRPRVAGRHIPRVHRARGARRPRLVRALHP